MGHKPLRIQDETEDVEFAELVEPDELASVEFADNPEPRCPCVLVLDTSSSMQGARIAALNAGLVMFQKGLAKDELAKRRVEVAVISFNNEVRVVQDFVTADRFIPPVLTAGGKTHMGGAINQALDLLAARKASYRKNGIAYFRPWCFMITDGQPEGEPLELVNQAINRLRREEAEKHVAFFAVGVEGANMAVLRKIVVRAPVKLVGLKFNEMFLWLSSSMEKVSQSRVGDEVALPPAGWATV